MNISENEIITFPDSNLEDVICEVINKPEGNIYLVDVIDITVLEAN